MSEMVTAVDLPTLQRRLDSLAFGGKLTLGLPTFRRLFGENDLGVARLTVFATGHGCTISATPSAITFHKQG